MVRGSENAKDARKGGSLVSELIGKILEILGALRFLVGEVKVHWESEIDRFLRRIEYLFILYLWISIGALFVVLGIFDLLVEYGKVPRPWVFLVGGLVILLIAVVILQAEKLRGKKR